MEEYRLRLQPQITGNAKRIKPPPNIRTAQRRQRQRTLVRAGGRVLLESMTEAYRHVVRQHLRAMGERYCQLPGNRLSGQLASGWSCDINSAKASTCGKYAPYSLLRRTFRPGIVATAGALLYRAGAGGAFRTDARVAS